MSGHSKKGSIAQKVLVTVGICLFVTLTLFILFIEHQSYQFQLTQLKHQQAQITQGQSILLSDQLAEGEEDAAFFTLSGILANPAIVGVVLDYHDNSNDLEIGDISTTLVHSENITFLDNDFNVSDIATITTYASTKHIDSALQNRAGYLAGLIAVLLITILFITASVLKKIVGYPLALIVNTIENKKIDDAAPISWQSNDEIGLVVKRLNTLHKNHQQRVVGLKQELSESEIRETKRLRNLANASFESVLIYVDNTILDANDRMLTMLNIDKSDILETELNTIFSDDLLKALNDELEDSENYYSNLPLALSDSSLMPVELYVSEFNYGSICARVAVMRDITDRIEAEKNIRFLAHHDCLTKLLNRTAFIEKYEEVVKKTETNKQFLAVMYMDLDNFKQVNDIYGHAAGDTLLKRVAAAITSSVGTDAIAARLGGDEFAIVVSGKDRYEVDPERIASTLLDSVNACRNTESVGRDFGASIGVSIYNGVGPLDSDLLAQADLALYHAKSAGRNIYKFYDRSLSDEQQSHRLMIDRLLDAINNNGLEMHYQPQVQTNTGELVGFEALLRWQDEILGNVSPIDIIAAAQKERLTEKLSEWILKAVCRDAISWPDQYKVSVNLTPADLANRSLTAYISALLSEINFPADRLDIEITESAIISDMEYAAKVVEDLKQMGITVALDDFGTGYSSLSFLHQLSFDRIKLDKSFVNTSEQKSLKIAEAVIELGKELGVEVLAEGVETPEQLERMRLQGCSLIQGYLISKPMPAHQVENYLQQHVVVEQRKAA